MPALAKRLDDFQVSASVRMTMMGRELAAKGVHEFAFVMQPLKIQGGTGSTVAPVAIR